LYFIIYIIFTVSLNPDVERLAFSVVWHIDSEGNVTDEWFGRTIIKSCAKLSYQHAQVTLTLYNHTPSFLFSHIYTNF